MPESYSFTLQPSETAIFRAAAGIFASYVTAGAVTQENEKEMMKKAIGVSISLARTVERLIQSDDELASSM